MGRLPILRDRISDSVHPHGRGAVCNTTGSGLGSGGPSPRAWGGYRNLHGGYALTGPSPRAWGGCQLALTGVNVTGPSPRAWGGLWNTRFSPDIRSIPTGVGRFLASASVLLAHAVHPHWCGAVIGRRGLGTPPSGPSPRVWGGSGTQHPHWPLARSIPTGVGRFRPYAELPVPKPVHPHGCGAVSRNATVRNNAIGPSPRLWGGFVDVPADMISARSIPTGVGRLSTPVSTLCSFPVHPHGCGAVFSSETKTWQQPRSIPTGVGRFNMPDPGRLSSGPSPRVWGGS